MNILSLNQGCLIGLIITLDALLLLFGWLSVKNKLKCPALPVESKEKHTAEINPLHCIKAVNFRERKRFF